MDRDVGETLSRLRMRRKYACIVLNPNKEQEGMIKKVKDLVAFGTINKETLEKLIEKRGQSINKKKKVDAKKVVEDLEKGKSLIDLNLKPFFRLHPPRKGINSKIHFPKGALGNHGSKINDLVLRML